MWRTKPAPPLLLDANCGPSTGAPTKRLRCLPGKKCQLAEMPTAGVSWETDDNGFIIAHAAQRDHRHHRAA
ncbi:YnfC family lipoprotein [Klebsiella pneumoniae subsp. pneumoniae]|nr:YnfC family lipoprotein [Klebsiella pneumoniae subsp. pneumoniae]